MARVSPVGIEAAAVVGDLEEDAVGIDVHPDGRVRRASVLDDVRQGLTADREQLRLGVARDRQVPDRALDSNGERRSLAAVLRTFVQRRHEPVLDGIPPKLVDEASHLALRCPRQLPDSCETPGRAAPTGPPAVAQRLLCRPRLQNRREQSLGDGVV